MNADPSVVVIFGASGDLTRRKLIPALYEMSCRGLLPESTCILGTARRSKSDAEWREELLPWVRDHAVGFDEASWSSFSERIHYHSGDATDPGAFAGLADRIRTLDGEYQCAGNTLFFLSVAPSLYRPIVECIGTSGLVTEGKRWCSLDRDTRSWQRIIVEKPFGTDDQTAASLNRVLGRAFEEESIYRIDHYLGKEVVQGILAFRFANTIFEPIWNHTYVDHVQITAAETVGVEDRVNFYDDAGAIRDMIQSHLFQILAFVAMEAPTLYSAQHVRAEKIKVIEALRIPEAEQLAQYCALGQYGPGDSDDTGYAGLEGVAEGSTTETFAALAFFIDNWRWTGTPFFLRSGKRLARKLTEVVIQFKPPAANLFRELPEFKQGRNLVPNRIVMEIAPRESIRVRFECKEPGLEFQLDTIDMDSDFQREFKSEPVEAYGPLIIEAMRGDQTLFKHRMEVEGAWRAVMPFLDDRSAGLRARIRDNYAPGSWGPDSSEELLARYGAEWNNEAVEQTT
ncbi:MAG: glucose-6-phosphate dehydrogenase [Planctomycetota bacterium]|nr:glucose-6-phosphate dehydrogenase [Planctomycetota bacterium]